jgi:hypothetical protein
MNGLVSARRRVVGSRLARWLCAAVLLAATGCRSDSPPADPGDSLTLAPQAVDLSPILELPMDVSKGVARAFPDYQQLVIGGVQQSNRRVRKDGVVELLRESYDSELDEENRWVVDVSLTRFDTPARAARELDASCYSQVHGGASSSVRWRESVYCISSVLHMHTDPRNLHLPTNTYFSWVIVRRDGLVLRLYERHQGSPKSAKNQIIREVAGRLSRIGAQSSGQ